MLNTSIISTGMGVQPIGASYRTSKSGMVRIVKSSHTALGQPEPLALFQGLLLSQSWGAATLG